MSAEVRWKDLNGPVLSIILVWINSMNAIQKSLKDRKTHSESVENVNVRYLDAEENIKKNKRIL